MNIINFLNLVGIFIIPFLVVLVPVYLGQLYGMHRINKLPDLKNSPVDTLVGAAFALLAFMLAFIFQIAASRYLDRKELLLNEVTNIRKVYLQAGLIEEPIRSDTKKLLVEYTDLRIDASKDTTKVKFLISRSQQILDTLWSYTEALAKQDHSSEIYALFTSSINELIDNYNHRVTMTFEYRIPPAILGMLYIIAFLTMFTLGYHYGLAVKGDLRINLVLAFIFALVMVLIIALDRPETGILKLNQKPVETLQKQLHIMQSAEHVSPSITKDFKSVIK